jgi:hypothetical protein
MMDLLIAIVLWIVRITGMLVALLGIFAIAHDAYVGHAIRWTASCMLILFGLSLVVGLPPVVFRPSRRHGPPNAGP